MRSTLRDMTRTLFSLAALVLLLSPGARGAEPTRQVEPKEVAGVVGAENGPLLLDVRTPEEYASGHVPGALLIPVQELEARLDQLAPYKARGVITYCEKGGRAGKAIEILRGAGFQNLAVLAGSMTRWRSEGLPVEQAPAPPQP